MKKSEEDGASEQKKTNDVDRYERLQSAAERQIENVWRAYDKHTSLIKWGVIVIVAVGGFFFWSNVNGFKEEIRENIQSQLTNITTHVDNELTSMTNRVETRVAEAFNRVDRGIEERFKRENIEPLIEAKVQTNVDRVTDKVITQTVHKQINPYLTGITNELATVEGNLLKAKDTSEELRESADLVLAIVDASDDDRYAFDKLVQKNNPTNRYYTTVVRALNTITEKYLLEDTPFAMRSLNWDVFHFKPDSASWDEYWALWPQLDPVGKGLLVKALSDQSRFSEFQKMGMYLNELENGQSLEVLSTVCKIVNNKTNINMNLLGAPIYLKWVASQFDDLSISNSTQIIQTNSADAMAYLQRADAYADKKDFERAHADLDTLRSINSTNSEIWNGIAWILATCRADSIRNGKEAVTLATKACESDKWQSWHFVGTLAAAYAEIGDFEQAIKYQKQSISMPGAPYSELAKQARRLDLFEKKKPAREPED